MIKSELKGLGPSIAHDASSFEDYIGGHEICGSKHWVSQSYGYQKNRNTHLHARRREPNQGHQKDTINEGAQALAQQQYKAEVAGQCLRGNTKDADLHTP